MSNQHQDRKLDTLPTGSHKTAVVGAMFDSIAGRYETLNHIITFGIDKRWRRQTLRLMRLTRGQVVLDLAAGTGDFHRLARSRGLNPVGADLSCEMLRVARKHKSASLDMDFVQADATNLPFANQSVDAITCGFGIRNFSDLATSFEEMARICKPEARIGILEATTPNHPVLVALHGLWMGQLVPRIGALFSSAFAYDYLPRSLAYLPPTDQLIEMLEDAGFKDVEHRLLTFGAAQLLTATRK